MDEKYPVDPALSILNCGSASPPACFCPMADPSICCCPVPGSPGLAGDIPECACVAQMRGLLGQFIALYNNENLTVTVDSGNIISGRPYALLPTPNTNPNAGLFQLVNEAGVPQEAIPLCHIAAVSVANANYKDTLSYLQVAVPTTEGCGDCLSVMRGYIPVGTEHVLIRAGGRIVGEGTVKKSEYGVAVLVGPNDSAPVFISMCKAEIIKY